ncbi:hypothetical protein [Nocardioides sp. SYSU D00038]|uniref:hypothetical protein n=1 Tax=Nocardioides sp. SYSU D00038 TaxID=2812554 RepID=UPI001967CDB1|nr:hypothetical protein [Nocardioides sp. SYSU D00038]
MITTLRRVALGATAVIALTLGATGVASAEQVVLDDPADATASPTDIRRVSADHTAKELFVKVRFAALPKKGASGISVYVDTDRARKGPELRLVGGLFDGTDYQLVRVKAWKDASNPLSCPHIMRLDRGTKQAKVRISAKCLGGADEVRVGVRMTDDSDGSHPVTDWLKKPRGWTRWLATD